MIEYKRLHDESDFDYGMRLIETKMELNPPNLDWQDIVELAGMGIHRDTLRKASQTDFGGYNVYKIMKEKLENGIYNDDILEEMQKKKDELYIQQVKTRDKLREYRATLRDEARIENLKDIFIESAEIISKSHPLKVNTYPNKKGKRVAIAQFADWHFGEIVNDFLNTYNEDVFDKRIEKLTNDIINYSAAMDVGTLKVLNCGDLVSGSLHVSTRVNESEDIVYQTMYVAETIANMLAEFASNIDEVEFYSVTDNHSRANKNKKEHIEKESLSRFIPWHLKTRLIDIKNIKIIENRINDIVEYDIGMFNIFHEKALFSHGHNDKLPTMVSDLSLMTRVFPIAVFTGHLHKNFEDEMHSIDLIMSPSAIGSGEYSKSIRRTSKPRQKMTIYENNNGNVERVSTFFINL